MKTSDLLNKDMGSCIDWLEDNPDLEISEPLSINKCIEYLKVNSSNLNREQVILFQSINVSCSCTACPECKEPDTAGFFCSKCIPL